MTVIKRLRLRKGVVSVIVRRRRLLALALIAVALLCVSISTLYVLGGDDLQVIINSWLSGKPKAMNKLIVTVPNAPQVSYCYVAVRRLPTPMEPTKDGYSQLLFFGRVGRGGTVVVRHMFNAIPVAYGVDKLGKTYVKYYEPKYYVVSVYCLGSNGKPLHDYSYSKLVEVRPRKLVNIVYVSWSPRTTVGSSKSGHVLPNRLTPGTGNGYDYASSCKIVITKEGRDLEGPYKEGYCEAWVAFTYVNSVPGLKTAIKFPEYPPAGIYFTAFSRYEDLTTAGKWEVSGKKIALSIISGTTDFVSDGESELILVKVRYNYEYHEIDGPDGGYIMSTEQLYPNEIIGVDDKPAGWYIEPSTHPLYATHLRNSYEISFGLGGSKETNEVTGVSTALTVSFGNAVSFTLTVNVYKAVRSDQQCSPPHFVIDDYSKEGYWWWFKNDNPLTYTIFLKRG